MKIMRHFNIYWLTASLVAPLVLVALLAIAPWQHIRAAGEQKVRPAGVAGSFYPADQRS